MSLGQAFIAALLSASCAAAQAAGAFDDVARRAAAALERDPAEAAKLYVQAVSLQPDWAEGWFYLGASRYQLKHYSEAQTAFERATALAGDNSASWAFLGLCEDELGDVSKALAHMLKAESLGLPDRPAFISAVRLHAAQIYMRSANFTMAVDQLRPLARAGDSSAPVIDTLGAAALSRSWLPSQIPVERRAMVELAGRALWSLYAQRADDTRALFAQLATQYPREAGVHYLYGIYFLDQDPKAAATEFRKELEISPSHALARVQLALLALKSGSPQLAVAPAEEAARLAPDNFLCHITLGRVLMEMDKMPAAIQQFEAAVKLAPDYPYTHFYLGQAYRNAGNIDESRKEFAEYNRLKTNQSGAADSATP